MSIEQNYHIPFVAQLALKEKQIQQNYRPIIAVHKWFARRPGTLFRALALAEFGPGGVEDTFFEAHDFKGKQVADPFMGGGTPLIEANRVGCDVQGWDINPMAAWIVREEIEQLDLVAYQQAAAELRATLTADLGPFYRTDCPLYGDQDLPVKCFLWLKQVSCTACGEDVPLFPGYRLAANSRHPAHVLFCSHCHRLNEVAEVESPGTCRHCDQPLALEGPAKRGQCACPSCGQVNAYPQPEHGPPRHRLIALEYYNAKRKQAGHKGRFFKVPDEKDFARFRTVQQLWQDHSPRFVPTQPILPGDETSRLLRWGYTHYRDLFNARQLYGLEKSAGLIAATPDERIRHALATNLSDLLRYQNMLCRYDTTALKSLDIFSVHGFPVGLMQAESNLLGIVNGDGMNVGSGGWSNIVEKYRRAKSYCEAPFEVRRDGQKKTQVPVAGEWIGEYRPGQRRRKVALECASSTDIDASLAPGSLDAVFTDPPYFGNVQYGELMDFCYVWLRSVLGETTAGFAPASSRDAGELTGNQTQGRTLEHFADGLAAVYRKMAQALKPGAPLAFTFHHNQPEAYQAVAVAILDAGLACSAALPCPAEMQGSIHIHGTGSSIVDTVFVCRDPEVVRSDGRGGTFEELAEQMASELVQLAAAGMTPTPGDKHCIALGHLARRAIGNLRDSWDDSLPASDKLAAVGEVMLEGGGPDLLADVADATHRLETAPAEHL